MGELEKILQENADFLKDVTIFMEQLQSKMQNEKNQEIVSYHPITSGHMLRPLLVHIVASVFVKEESFKEEDRSRLVYFAAAVEYMHNASLLHDDLLDQEENRRGKPCLYQKYGFKHGLLVGNIFYIKAIELSCKKLKQEQTSDLLDTAIAMCEGEMLQAQYDKLLMPEEIYEQVVRLKTGKLMALSCRQAAAIMGAKEEIIDLFGKFGEELGVLYQMRDDKKDQDANITEDVDLENMIQTCNQKIISYLEIIAQKENVEQLKEIAAYFKK